MLTFCQDPTLKRCFGIDTKIADCDWDYLRTLQTVREPRQGMPRLSDLLEWLTGPGLESIWVLLDVKLDDDPEELISAIAETIKSVPPAPGGRPWAERVAVGCWNVRLVSFSFPPSRFLVPPLQQHIYQQHL